LFEPSLSVSPCMGAWWDQTALAGGEANKLQQTALFKFQNTGHKTKILAHQLLFGY